jgi:hypothetical protein
MADESSKQAIELSESRKGVHLQAEVGLPPGFDPPSAALAPPPVELVNAPGASGQADTAQAPAKGTVALPSATVPK